MNGCRRSKPDCSKSAAPSPTQVTEAGAASTQHGKRLQRLDAQIAKLEMNLQALASRIIEAQTEQALVSANDQPARSQEPERDAEEAAAAQEQTFATMLAEIDNRHALQAVDSVWAKAKEKDLWIAYEQSSMQERVEIDAIDCRFDICTLDFNLAPADDGLPPENELEKWVFANAGNCGYTIEGAALGNDFEAGSVRRVWLHDCQ